MVMKQIDENLNETCCYNAQHSAFYGKTFKKVCGKKATHTNGQHFFCRHHSKTGRYVARIGDVGDILARFDTEKQLRENIHLYPNAIMQKVTKSSRRDIR